MPQHHYKGRHAVYIGMVTPFTSEQPRRLCRNIHSVHFGMATPFGRNLHTNVQIPDFDKIISVIRSRGISVSIILQSISQLSAVYGHEKSITIINNCDNCLYLGGQDVETARYIAVKASKTADTILGMPLDNAYLFTRGSRPKIVKKYDIRSHEAYHELQEAAADAGSI